jgi:hypothetical protein
VAYVPRYVSVAECLEKAVRNESFSELRPRQSVTDEFLVFMEQ